MVYSGPRGVPSPDVPGSPGYPQWYLETTQSWVSNPGPNTKQTDISTFYHSGELDFLFVCFKCNVRCRLYRYLLIGRLPFVFVVLWPCTSFYFWWRPVCLLFLLFLAHGNWVSQVRFRFKPCFSWLFCLSAFWVGYYVLKKSILDSGTLSLGGSRKVGSVFSPIALSPDWCI